MGTGISSYGQLITPKDANKVFTEWINPHNMNHKMSECNCQFLLYTGMLAGAIVGVLFLVFVCWCISFCICMRGSRCPLHKIYYKRTIQNLEGTPPMQEQTQTEQTQTEQTQAEQTHGEQTQAEQTTF